MQPDEIYSPESSDDTGVGVVSGRALLIGALFCVAVVLYCAYVIA